MFFSDWKFNYQNPFNATFLKHQIEINSINMVQHLLIILSCLVFDYMLSIQLKEYFQIHFILHEFYRITWY